MTSEDYNVQRHIYLADDDRDDRDFFADAILEIDPEIVLKQSPDGMHLMDSLSDLSKKKLPEFIFLDINMPGKSGLECLEEIRKCENLRDVNVIMLSTSRDPDNIRQTFDKGATFYAVKPTSYEKLKSLLKYILTINLISEQAKNRNFLLI